MTRDLRSERLTAAARSSSWHDRDGERRRAELGATTEKWLHQLWLAAAGESARGLALAAVGSQARREAGPASDLDLIFLHDGRTLASGEISCLADQLWYPIWDSGLTLDHSVRNPSQCRDISGKDLIAGLGLLDIRVISGDADLVAATRARLLADWRAAARRRLPELLELVAQRVASFGDAAFLIEPDIKNSRGGLRDITFLRGLTASWLADRPHGSVEEAQRTLLDVRDALHVITGKSSEKLLLADQDTVAGLLGSVDADELLTSVSGAARVISYAVDTTARRARQALPQRRFRSGPRRPSLRPLGHGLVEHDGEVVLGVGIKPEQDPLVVLRAAATAGHHGLPLSPITVTHLATASAPLTAPWSPRAVELFVELLGVGPALIPVWEALDLAGLPSRWIPGWAAIRSRPQRNAIHRHTVDRHLIETVVEAAKLVRSVDRPDLLLMAALLHDIGKLPGAGDHSSVGAPLARHAARALGFCDPDVDVIERLVREHLTLIDLATRRDPDDPQTVQAVVAAVDGRGDVLDLLRALTQADAIAAGPAAWTTWRARLVADLVARARTVLTGQPVPTPAPLTARENQLLELVRQGEQPQVDISVVDEMHVVTVVAADRLGLFGDIAGLLAAEGLSVRSALVRTVPGGPDGAIAVDGWWVTSPYGELPSTASLVTSLRRLAAGDQSMLARLARRDAAFRPPPSAPAQPRAMLVPGASAAASVVEVRAGDRPGLLHALGRTLEDLRVDIRSAHVATHAGQAVDTLYLCEPGGGPLNPARTAGVISALVDAGVSPVRR